VLRQQILANTAVYSLCSPERQRRRGIFRRLSFFFLAVLAVASLGVDQAEGREISGRAHVVDGDTINIGANKIRLSGFDAPESKQSCRRDDAVYNCGLVATEALRQLTVGQTVRCQTSEKDRYGRWIGTCFVNDLNVGAWMVSKGYAVAYRRYSSAYIADEEAAKAQGRGLWAGSFVMPWDWRRGKRLVEAPAANQTCHIKGNISRNGDRIYHTPDSPSYSRTKISEDKGERCFNSEADAAAAGWRPAKY
tara:strand:- start:3392 stop:4141 length:750 start_codon:yes stop_codon:yes gene_type:complete